MSRTALALLALLSVAEAAHKASGGSSLHAIAITDEPTTANYYTTNGNGTWAANTNRVYLQKANCMGAAASGAAAGISPVYKSAPGITDVTFPSRLLGIAVGVGCTYTTQYINNFPPDTTTVAAVANVPVYTPTVLTTFDQGATWQLVTGFSTKPLSFAQTRQPRSNTVNALLSTTAFVSYPAPDLMAAHCTTRSLCFAVGGYFGTTAASTNAATTAQVAALASVTAGTANAFPTIVAAALPVAGAVIRSTNGGTFWTYVSIPPMIGATADDVLQGNPQPVPGLMDIHTDSSGRHVYAVGAPFFKYDYVAPATNAAPTSFGPGSATGANVWGATAPIVLTAANTPSSTVATGSIIYSGSYGVSNSWVVQVAPAIPGLWYGLNAVHVLRGTAALAVGGSPFGISYDQWFIRQAGGAAYPTTVTGVTVANVGGYNAATSAPLQQSGVLLVTLNGGFSWNQMARPPFLTLPSWTYYNQAAAGQYVVNTVDKSSGHLPALNGVACYATSVAGAGYYNCMAVGNFGYVVKAQIPAATVANSFTTISTSISSVTWSYQNVTQVSPQTGYLNIYGISWDNNVVGYMYGANFILSTHDGGASWVAETPNAVITGSSTNYNVIGLATVPTTY